MNLSGFSPGSGYVCDGRFEFESRFRFGMFHGMIRDSAVCLCLSLRLSFFLIFSLRNLAIDLLYVDLIWVLVADEMNERDDGAIERGLMLLLWACDDG